MRTKGATSNVWVSLRALNKLFNEDAMILVARRFAQQNNLIGKAVYATNDTIEASGNQPALEEGCSIQENIEEEPEVASGDTCTNCGNPIDHNEPHMQCDNCREK